MPWARMSPPFFLTPESSFLFFCAASASYDSAFRTKLCTFSLRAVIVHLGDAPTSGHDRAFLLFSSWGHNIVNAKSPTYCSDVPECVRCCLVDWMTLRFPSRENHDALWARLRPVPTARQAKTSLQRLMYVCMYVRMYVCMYVCMCVCVYVRMCVCVCVYVCVCVCMCVCMYAC